MGRGNVYGGIEFVASIDLRDAEALIFFSNSESGRQSARKLPTK
ncbi:hypothetical protein C4K02_4341 [Pseudomonas synxantha]|nr:hypothetical protein C4K02_4341 [Pseudomonas synxantha]